MTKANNRVSEALEKVRAKARRRMIRQLPQFANTLRYFDPLAAARVTTALVRESGIVRDRTEVQSVESRNNNHVHNTSLKHKQSTADESDSSELTLSETNDASDPEVISVICDGLGLSWQVGSLGQQKIVLQHIKFLQTKKPGRLHLKKVFINNSGYRFNASIESGDESLGLIFANPTSRYKSRRFVYVKCNPAKTGVNGFWQVIEEVSFIIGQFPEQTIENAYVSFMDPAFDVKNEVVGNLTVRPSRGANSGIALHFFTEGKLLQATIETQYGGANRSPVSSRTYDKCADYKKKGIVIGFDLTRQEFRVRPRITVPGPNDKTVTRSCHPHEIRQLGNPLKKFVISRFPEQVDQDLSFHLLLVLSRWIGITAALKHVRHDRAALERFRRRVTKGVVSWWNPDELWRQYLDYLDQLFCNPKQSIEATRTKRPLRRL